MKNIKKYKYSCCNKWGIDQAGADKEILRAGKFLIAQIKKGWSVVEAMEQVENSYGYLVSNTCFKYIGRACSK